MSGVANELNTDWIYTLLYLHLFKISNTDIDMNVLDMKIENHIWRNLDTNIFWIFPEYQLRKKTDTDQIWIGKKMNLNRM